MRSPKLPKGWRKAPLSSLSDVQTGIAKGKRVNGSPISLPYLRVANVQDGYVDLSVIKEITVDQTDVERYSLRDGDVLFTEGGDFDKLGRGTVWQGQIAPCLHQNHVFAVRPKSSLLLPEFLAYQAASEYGRRYFRLSSKQSTNLASINSTQLKEFPVLFPSLPEQRKIGEILRTWDEAIEKLEGLKAAKERYRNWLCSHLISLGAQDAPRVTFGEFLTESREQGANGVTARKISVKLYGKGAVEKPGSRAGSKNTRYYRRSAGQLVYSKLDFLNGAFAIVDQALDGFESTLDLPAFDVSPEVNVKWLIEYLTRPAFYSQQVHLARGQRKARRIAPDDFLASYVRLPNQTEQDRIVEILAQADHELSMEVQTLQLIRDQKRGLMQKLLTGEWRVPVEGRHD